MDILLVHGAFCDGSSWANTIPLLQDAGHHVVAVQNPLTSLADDIASTRRALGQLDGPTVLAGHSYGGSVISGAAVDAPNVVALVYIAAFAPAEGQTTNDSVADFPPAEGMTKISADADGYATIDRALFGALFAGDADPIQQRVMAVVQKPTAGPCFYAPSGPVAYGRVPSWFLVSDNDHIINPDAQRAAARRIGATVSSVPSSHASPVAHPREVAEIILAATSVPAPAR